MSGPTVWWWIRHAPVPDAEGRIHGRRDVDCDVSDGAAFRLLAAALPRDAVTIISPLVRTRQTLEGLRRIAPGQFGEPLVEPGFIEQSFGTWEGLSWPAMEARDPAAYATFWQDPTRNAAPAGESFSQQMQRTADAIERLSSTYDGRDIVCVAHGGTIRAAVAHALGLTPEAAMAIVVDNLSLTRLARVQGGILQSRGGAWRVEQVNAPVH